jgi:hypothetical protein
VGPCLFLLEHLFCLSHHKTHWTMLVNNADLAICLLETLNFMITLTFSLGVNRSGPGTSSTTNHKFYKALGWLHGPWCKQPLRATSHTSQEPWPWNCESPKESVQRPSQVTLQNHVVWSRILTCSVKPYVTGPTTKCYFNELLFMRYPHT